MGSQRVEHKLAAEQQQSKRAGIWREGRRENRRFPGKVTELYQPYEMVIVKRNAIDGYSYSDRIICFSAHPPSLKKKKSESKSVSHSVVFNSLRSVQTLQAPLSMEFSRPEHWSGQPFPSSGDLPYLGIKPGSPALQADSLPSERPRKLLSFLPGDRTFLPLVSNFLSLSFSLFVCMCGL